MYGTSIEKAASSSISLWANLSHGRGWDVGGTTMWWGWGGDWRGRVGEYHNESNSCTSSHHTVMPWIHPTSKAPPYSTMLATQSLSYYPTLPWYITLLHIIIQSPIQPAKTPGAAIAVDVNIRGGESDAYLRRGLELKVSFYCKYDIYHIYGDGSDSGCEWIVMV